jgi:hypothetical protein
MALQLTASQDGAHFFIRDQDDQHAHVAAPFPVKDGDMEAAKRARRWFKQYCIDQGWGVVPLVP